MTGHRARLRQKLRESGITALSQAQIIELLLFYTIPRRDTLPVAERLLERFSSLGGVFTASIGDLTSVKGVSEASAVLLRAVADIYIEYAEPDFVGKISAEFPSAVELLFKNMSKGENKPEILAAFVDENGFAARCEHYPAESSSVGKIAETAKKYGFSGVICEDFGCEMSKEIAQRLSAEGVGCEILDNI